MKYFVLISLMLLTNPVFAFTDCIITNDAKLSDIKIENHDIVDIYPLITIMNEKNTLIVHPLKEGNTRFSVLKNNKNISLFSVQVDADKTTISEESGFEVVSIDTPPETYEYELDTPPI